MPERPRQALSNKNSFQCQVLPLGEQPHPLHTRVMHNINHVCHTENLRLAEFFRVQLEFEAHFARRHESE